jgi:hypothetical protein
LWLYPEKEAEKIPMGFDSEESFAEMDEDGNMANGIRVEMMKLKPVEIKEGHGKKKKRGGLDPVRQNGKM